MAHELLGGRVHHLYSKEPEPQLPVRVMEEPATWGELSEGVMVREGHDVGVGVGVPESARGNRLSVGESVRLLVGVELTVGIGIPVPGGCVEGVGDGTAVKVAGVVGGAVSVGVAAASVAVDCGAAACTAVGALAGERSAPEKGRAVASERWGLVAGEGVGVGVGVLVRVAATLSAVSAALAEGAAALCAG